MGKETTPFFPHYGDAGEEDKILRLRMKHKSSGYGVYCLLLERLLKSVTYTCVKDYNMLGFKLREDASLIKSVVEDFGLFTFTEDGEYFYSESFNQLMTPYLDVREKRSVAGKKGMKNRWGAKKNTPIEPKIVHTNNVITKLPNSDNNVITKNNYKRREEKRREENIYIHTHAEKNLISETETKSTLENEIEAVLVNCPEAVAKLFRTWVSAINEEAARAGSQVKPITALTVGASYAALLSGNKNIPEQIETLNNAIAGRWQSLASNYKKSIKQNTRKQDVNDPTTYRNDIWKDATITSENYWDEIRK